MEDKKAWKKKKEEPMAPKEEMNVPPELEKKVAAIRSSAMPEKQKLALMKKIGLVSEKKEQGVMFDVYAKVKKIDAGLAKAMSVFPAAQKVRLATFNEWDEIFKDF